MWKWFDKGIFPNSILKLISRARHVSQNPVKIGSDNGLVPPDNKPLHEPMLTHIYVTMWRHYPTMPISILGENL